MGIYGGVLLEKLDQDRVVEKKYCNVTITVDDCSFQGHRFLLGTVCGYFRQIFNDEPDEGGVNKREINLDK